MVKPGFLPDFGTGEDKPPDQSGPDTNDRHTSGDNHRASLTRFRLWLGFATFCLILGAITIVAVTVGVSTGFVAAITASGLLVAVMKAC